MISYSFGGDLPAGSTGNINLPVVPAGQEYIYQCLTISCNDDSAVHHVDLIRISDNWLFFVVDFITGGIFDFPGQLIEAGKQVRLRITNNSASTLTFSGAINYIMRSIS